MLTLSYEFGRKSRVEHEIILNSRTSILVHTFFNNESLYLSQQFTAQIIINLTAVKKSIFEL